MARKTLLFLILAGIGLCCSGPALADNIHLCDINATTSCNANSVIPVYFGQSQGWVFGKAAGGETLYVVALTPMSGTSGAFNANTNLSALLGFGSGFANFSSTHDQELGATGIAAGSFSVTSFKIGAWTGTVNSGQLVTLPTGPVGTIYIAYLVDSSGNLVGVSPWSSALIYLPEPSSMTLAGIGLLALSALFGRRLLTN